MDIWYYSSLYMKWTPTTAMCYRAKMQCDVCNNSYVCLNIGLKDKKGVPIIKTATLKTFANIGTKGLEKYFIMPEDKTSRSGLIDPHRY